MRHPTMTWTWTPTRRAVLAATIVLGLLATAGDAAGPQQTTRVSVSSTGVAGNGESYPVFISADGNHVAFISTASNLVPGDTNEVQDIFVHDRQTRRTTRVSVSSSGQQANNASFYASISGTGRFVAFYSNATNLAPGGHPDVSGSVYLHDRARRTTTRVSVNSAGEPADGSSYLPAISADGQFIAFWSSAGNLAPGATGDNVYLHNRLTRTTTLVSRNSAGEAGPGFGHGLLAISGRGRYVAFRSFFPLVPEDTNNREDLYVRDMQAGTTERVTVSSTGEQITDGQIDWPFGISGDGRYVVFSSNADNLVLGDTNHASDIFLRDRQTGQTRRVSLAADGAQADSDSLDPTISLDGRWVAFRSNASNLVVPNDPDTASPDVFVVSLETGAVQRASVSVTGGVPEDCGSGDASLSGNGRYVAFTSCAGDLVPGDKADDPCEGCFEWDAFVRKLW
jgi:Tol biopolymer transport system component